MAILKYHVIPSKAMAADVIKLNGKKVKTVEGSEVTITVKDGTVLVNNAKVVKTDIITSNGVIHVIDTVILPPEKQVGHIRVAQQNDSHLAFRRWGSSFVF
ncbi:MAG: fasciclin domain-containing protein [Planctomycetales bacterium]